MQRVFHKPLNKLTIPLQITVCSPYKHSNFLFPYTSIKSGSSASIFFIAKDPEENSNRLFINNGRKRAGTKGISLIYISAGCRPLKLALPPSDIGAAVGGIKVFSHFERSTVPRTKILWMLRSREFTEVLMENARAREIT